MSGPRSELAMLAASDKRYAIEAYQFLWHALSYTQETLGRVPKKSGKSAIPDEEEDAEVRHVTGRELLEGIRQLGLEQFGMMAAVVFKMWGVHTTSDFGNMVYRLIDAGHWHRAATDRQEDFDDCYDFEEAFVRDFRWNWDEDIL